MRGDPASLIVDRPGDADRAGYRMWCFPPRGGAAAAPAIATVDLCSRAAQALANLLPLLGCGEEAAAMAFGGLADGCRDDAEARAALSRIAAEEDVHQQLLAGIARALPAPTDVAPRLKAARRFHVGLARGGAVDHLARIAALDAAVCTILARLTRKGAPLGTDPMTAATFTRIHADEARHVRVARGLAMGRGGRSLADTAAVARRGLADLLALAADDLEALAFDPAWLASVVAPLPDGLFG